MTATQSKEVTTRFELIDSTELVVVSTTALIFCIAGGVLNLLDLHGWGSVSYVMMTVTWIFGQMYLTRSRALLCIVHERRIRRTDLANMGIIHVPVKRG